MLSDKVNYISGFHLSDGFYDATALPDRSKCAERSR